MLYCGEELVKAVIPIIGSLDIPQFMIQVTRNQLVKGVPECLLLLMSGQTLFDPFAF